jgi:hypothetical protein
MRLYRHSLIALLLALCAAQPALSRNTLGIYHGWGAFQDEAPARCFAIARPSTHMAGRDWQPFAAIGYYPPQRVYGQFHARLRYNLRPGSRITATIDDRRFTLIGRGSDAWAMDATQDAALIRAMRSARGISIEAVASTGQGFADSYRLRGAASAIDAAAIACSR